MALGIPTRIGNYGGGEPGEPLHFDILSFLGDGAYVAGGTVVGSTNLASIAAMKGKTIIAVIHLDSSNMRYELRWDATNAKLKLLDVQTNAEAGNADYSAITFKALVISR